MKRILIFCMFCAIGFSITFCQKPKVLVGAYYFDGWTGTYPQHLTAKLRDSFPEREPKWGWLTSQQSIMDQQIMEAYNSGLSFFNFCWYYNGKEKYKEEPLNNALKLYLKSPHKSKMKFCLMVANHKGFEIGPNEWPMLSEDWIGHFKEKNYLMLNGQPLLVFFSITSFMNKFESADKVKEALESLRMKAKSKGLNGVSIAICVSPNKQNIEFAEACGFDLLTGYNYHSAAFIADQKELPISSLQKSEVEIWDKITSLTRLKYIPVSTLNWDDRPWLQPKDASKASYYVGFSPETVFNSVKSGISWIGGNKNSTPKDKILFLYAWNEYGEGAWLTPSKNGVNMLDGLKDAVKKGR